MRKVASLFLFLIPLSIWGQFDLNKVANPEKYGLSSARLQEMNHYMHSLVDSNALAGIQTAVIRNGQLVHYDSYGFANLEEKIALNEKSIFRIFSMTKPITSVALMQLFEQGKFELNDPLSKFIPEFENSKVYQDSTLALAQSPIRIIDLLRHSSGLSYGRGVPQELAAYYGRAQLYGSEDIAEFTRRASTLPLQFEPGTDWQYGISTSICGRLIEVLSGQELDDYLQEHVFLPLEMTDTHFQLPDSKVERFTVGYRWSEEQNLYVSEDQRNNRYTREVSLYNGGGGLVSTLKDYLNFCQMLLNKGKFKDQQLLKEKTIALMLQDHLTEIRPRHERLRLPPNEFGFGLGFAIRGSAETGLEKVYGWGGAVGTYFKIDTDNEMAYVMMIQISPYRHLGLRERFHQFVQSARLN